VGLKLVHRIFQTFINRLSVSEDTPNLRDVMAEAAAAIDLSCFAYLSMPSRSNESPLLISTYPVVWTNHYIQSHYERLDPVINQALDSPEPFEWGSEIKTQKLSSPQRELLAEAAQFGIRHGYTIPIHDGRGPIAAVTFAADEHRSAAFHRSIEEYKHGLQLMAMYFHAHARRKVAGARTIDGVSLSPREFECLEWAARGKSAWEIGRILGISRHTAATYLETTKAKLGVRTIVQAVARLIASN
jgi:DNA-binding CsgD family transcriptional regulator